MEMGCFSCGVLKDTNIFEFYTEGDELVTDKPIKPLIVVQCCDDVGGPPYRAVAVCHKCFHRMDPDMWIDRATWQGVSPRVPFDDLPGIQPGVWDAEAYAGV